MKTTIAGTLLASIFVTLQQCFSPSPPPPVPNPAAKFLRMEMALETRDRSKDADTRLEFAIVKATGAPAVGYLDIRGQGFAASTTVSEVIPPVEPGFTFGELKQENLWVKITPNGNNTWTYAIPQAKIYFSDGTIAIFSTGNEVLTENDREETIPFAGALTIVPPPAPSGSH